MFRTKEAMYTGPSFILSENDAVDAMGRARQRIGANSTSVLTTVDDLYTMERVVDTTNLNGQLIEVDDFLLTKSGKPTQIEKIYQKYQGGKWKIRFKVAGDDKIYSEAQFKAKFDIPTIGISERQYKSNAINFHANERSVFSSTMVMPATVDLSSFPDKFFSDENEWLKLKEKASVAAEKLESIDKVFYQNFRAHKILNRKGDIAESVDIPFAIVNRVPENQLELFARMLKLSVPAVQKMGLDILSIDGEPEIGFLKQKDTGEILATENKLAEKHPEDFQAYLDSNDIESAEYQKLKTMIEESFADETDSSVRQKLIDFNLYKLKVVWVGNQMAMEQGQDSALIDGSTNIQAPHPRTKRYTKEAISFDTLVTNMENDGYTFTGRFEYGKTSRKEQGGEFVKIFRPVYAVFDNKQTGDSVRIELNGKKIRTKDAMETVSTLALEELRNEKSELDALIKRMDALLKDKRMADFDTKEWQEYNELKHQIAPLLGETLAYSLIKNNREELKRRMNKHGDDVLNQWLEITKVEEDGRYNLHVSGGVNPERRRAGLTRLMGYFTELYKADKDFNLYMSPFGKAVNEKVKVKPENLETYVEGMNQPQLHLHPVDPSVFDAYKSSSKTQTETDDSSAGDIDEMFDNATTDSNMDNFDFINEEQGIDELVDL